MSRALTIAQVYEQKRKLHKLHGEFAKLIGEEIELTGSWFIWGGSNSGKTSFSTQLAKMLTEYGKVVYNSLEEKTSYTFVLALKRAQMEDVADKITILVAEPYAELVERLEKPKSANIVFIDSYQHSKMNFTQYLELINKFPKKLFVFISQAKGREPKTEDAASVKYGSDVKIWIEGCKAFPQSRYGGQTPYTIWKERAAIYWGDSDRINYDNKDDSNETHI